MHPIDRTKPEHDVLPVRNLIFLFNETEMNRDICAITRAHQAPKSSAF